MLVNASTKALVNNKKKIEKIFRKKNKQEKMI
jgi:hypothetical protein